MTFFSRLMQSSKSSKMRIHIRTSTKAAIVVIRYFTDVFL